MAQLTILWLPLFLAVMVTSEGNDDVPNTTQISIRQDHPVPLTMLSEFRQGYKYDGSLNSADFSRDGTKIVTSANKRIRVWDAETGNPLATIKDPAGEKTFAFEATFDPKARWVAVCGPWMPVRVGRRTGWEGGIVRVWDLDNQIDVTGYLEIFRFASAEHILLISISENGRYISCIDRHYNFFLIDTVKTRSAIVEPTMVLNPANEIRGSSARRPGQESGFSDDGHRVVATAVRSDGKGGGILFYDASRQTVRLVTDDELARAVGSDLPQRDHGARKAVISPDGKLVAFRFSWNTNIAYLIEFESLRLVREYSLKDSEEIDHLAIDPDARFLALGTTKGALRVFEVETGLQHTTQATEGPGPIRTMRFVGDRLRLLSGAGTRAEELPPEPGEGVDPSRLYIWDVHLSRDDPAEPE